MTIISPDADKNPPNGTHYILLETLYTDFRRESVRSFFRQRKPNAFIQGFDYANSWDHICIGNFIAVTLQSINLENENSHFYIF